MEVYENRPTIGASQPGSVAGGTDEASVRVVLARLYEAWSAGDAKAYAALFTPDADYTAFDGTLMKGRDEIVAGHEPLFRGIMRGSRLVEQSSAVRFLTPECALITSRGGIVMSWQGRRAEPSRKRVSAQTLVAVRHDDHWLLAAFQNTRYRPWARTLMGRAMTALSRRQSSNSG